MSEVDLDDFRFKPIASVARSARPPDKLRGLFIRPLPLRWITRATPLRGKALGVALALWFQAGRVKQMTVKLTGANLARFGIERNAGYRGLKALEEAGLVSVVRQVGRCPMVTILVSGDDHGGKEPDHV